MDRKWNAVVVALALSCAVTIESQAVAQVFKCVGPGGSVVYSQQPCGAGAVEVRVRSAEPSSSAPVNRSQGLNAADERAALNAVRFQEQSCVRSAEDPIRRQSGVRIREYQRQIDALTAQTRLANNNLAGATYEAGLRGQIGSLQASIATERASADSQAATARMQCSETRRRAEEDVRAKTTAAGSIRDEG